MVRKPLGLRAIVKCSILLRTQMQKTQAGPNSLRKPLGLRANVKCTSGGSLQKIYLHHASFGTGLDASLAPIMTSLAAGFSSAA